MQAVVIFDEQGHIWNVTYGDSVKPKELSAARMEIPDGNQLTGVDLSDPSNPAPVFESLPVSDYVKIQKQMEELQAANALLTEELTSAQLALAEIYEEMEGK